jgi:hypothetical protein
MKSETRKSKAAAKYETQIILVDVPKKRDVGKGKKMEWQLDINQTKPPSLIAVVKKQIKNPPNHLHETCQLVYAVASLPVSV